MKIKVKENWRTIFTDEILSPFYPPYCHNVSTKLAHNIALPMANQQYAIEIANR